MKQNLTQKRHIHTPATAHPAACMPRAQPAVSEDREKRERERGAREREERARERGRERAVY